eukprot:scaffold105311_cov20-Cyclotella_meneghiniana.AAC.1
MFINKFAFASIVAIAVNPSAGDSIYDVASSTEGFGTLAAAIDAAGLTDALSGDGTFTVFAPNDAAFEALPE